MENRVAAALTAAFMAAAPPAHAQETAPNPSIVATIPDAGAYTVDSIPAGARFTHDGPVIVKSGVGAGAKVVITNGGLLVKGGVDDGAVISVKDGSSHEKSGGIGSNNNNMNISIGGSKGGESTVIIDGKVVADRESRGISIRNGIVKTGGNGLSGVEIEGHTGEGVTILSNEDIRMKDAGACLTAQAKGSFYGENFGSQSDIKAGNSIHFASGGEGSELKAGNSIFGAQLGGSSSVVAGNATHIASPPYTPQADRPGGVAGSITINGENTPLVPGEGVIITNNGGSGTFKVTPLAPKP